MQNRVCLDDGTPQSSLFHTVVNIRNCEPVTCCFPCSREVKSWLRYVKAFQYFSMSPLIMHTSVNKSITLLIPYPLDFAYRSHDMMQKPPECILYPLDCPVLQSLKRPSPHFTVKMTSFFLHYGMQNDDSGMTYRSNRYGKVYKTRSTLQL